MSFLGRLLQRTLASKDAEADIIAAAASPTVGSKLGLTSAEKKKIDEYLKLSDSTTIDVKERLAAYRDCNAIISQLPPSASERAQVINKSIAVVCPPGKRFPPVPNARGTIPILISEPNSFHRVVDAPAQVLPDVDDVFEQVLESSDTVKHPSGLSALTFAFASLISLCKSYPSYEDPSVNQNSGLFDLYPLYGPTEQEARDTIRVIEPDEIGYGLLLPDAFYEVGERLEFLPKATSVLLILFNRNHNSIARQLLKENQQSRWVDPTTLEAGSDERQLQDDEIYELAKRVNCALFRNIVTTDFLKGLLGLSPLDDSPAIDLILEGESADSHVNTVEFLFIYNWLATFSDPDVETVKEALSQIDDPEEVIADEYDSFCADYINIADTDRASRPSAGLVREDDNKFNDTSLATILQQATEVTAHAFRPSGTSRILHPIEASAMERARLYKVCTFNKFREALGLAPYKSFEEWCGDAEVVKAAERLYNSIDNLELYPGLRAEKELDGRGLRLGETLTYALVTDIVQVVRSDPAFKEDQKLEEVTKVGANVIKTNPDNGAFGSSLPSVILTNLPNNYNPNSAYGLYPFATPEKATELLKERADAAAAEGRQEVPGPNDIDFEQPKPVTTHTITDADAAQQILNDNTFKNPLIKDIVQLTNGLGILLGFDQDSHNQDDYNTLSSLLTDKKAMYRYSFFFKSAIRKYLKRYSNEGGAKGRIVNYQDVINGAAAAWAAEVLCGVTLDQENKLTTEDFFEKLKVINDTLFGAISPQDTFTSLKKAKDAAKLIRQLISQGISSATEDPETEETFLQMILNLLRELLLGEPPHGHKTHSAHNFLARVAASGRNKEELTANILGFAAFSSISFAQTLGTAVSFYLSDARSDERATLIDLSRPDASSLSGLNDRILGYVREAERLSQTTSITLEAQQDKVITLSTGETLEVKKGDRLVIDPSALKGEDATVDPARTDGKGPSFFPFIEGTVPEAVKVIFGLEGIASEKGANTMTYLPAKAGEGSQLRFKKKGTPYFRYIFDIFLISLVIYLSSVAWNAAGDAIDRINTLRCSTPSHIRPWETYTMLPGPDNRTVPFIITLDSTKKRRITFVDIDKRDMQFQISVNGRKKAISSDFVLDKDVDCGDNVEQCLSQGFSRASVIISAGKQVVKVEWVGKDIVPGTNLIDWGLEKNRRFMWKQEAC